MNEPTASLLPFQIKPAYGLNSQLVEDPVLGLGLGLGQGVGQGFGQGGLQVPCANSEDDANAKANRTRKMKNLNLI
jgi:hypothetical protein